MWGCFTSRGPCEDRDERAVVGYVARERAARTIGSRENAGEKGRPENRSLRRGQHLVHLKRDLHEGRRAHPLAPGVPPPQAEAALARLGVDLDDA
jgi:hypothetical protein